MAKINNANLVTKETAEKLQLLKDWLPTKFSTTDFDVIERGKNQWVRLKPQIAPQNSTGALPPFSVILSKTDLGVNYVTVTHGLVIERQLTAGLAENALIEHPCNNRLTTGVPTKFNVNAGQAIYVQVLEDNLGAVKPGADVILLVGNDGLESTNHIPTSQDGEYYYRLAAFEADGDALIMVPYAAGSHIYHETGLTADAILRDCPTFSEGDPTPIPGAQLFRLSFVSGRLVSSGESEAARPYADTKEETTVMYCS